MTKISVEDAIRWVERWRRSGNRSINLYGFLIPYFELSQLVSKDVVVDYRSYFAIDDDHELLLLFVGVDEDGNDLIDPDNGHFIYEYTKPCPPGCSKNGPLS